jgi:hypothetical protein
MTNLENVSLFDSLGRFNPEVEAIEASIADDPSKQARWEGVKAAAMAMTGREQMIEATKERIKTLQQSVADLQRQLEASRPKRSFMDEWRANRGAV